MIHIDQARSLPQGSAACEEQSWNLKPEDSLCSLQHENSESWTRRRASTEGAHTSIIYVRTSHYMRNTSDRQASICRWLIEAIHFQDFVHLVYVKALAGGDLFCSPLQSLKMLLDAFKWPSHVIYGAHFDTVQLRHDQVRANVLQRATRGAEDTQFADKHAAAVVLSTKACRSSSATCSVCSFPSFAPGLCLIAYMGGSCFIFVKKVLLQVLIKMRAQVWAPSGACWYFRIFSVLAKPNVITFAASKKEEKDLKFKWD